MKKIDLEGFSAQIVDDNLFLGQEYYGNIGTLLGVIEDDYKQYAVMQNEQQHVYLKKAVIDTTIEENKKGPTISQTLFLGKENLFLSPMQADHMKYNMEKLGDLTAGANGEVNIDIFLSHKEHTAYIGSDDLISYLHMLKKTHPSYPLRASLDLYPYHEKKKEL